MTFIDHYLDPLRRPPPPLTPDQAENDHFTPTCLWMWDDVDAVQRLARGIDRQWSILFDFGFLRRDGEDITPAMSTRRVRFVLSYYERGTASQMAWNWLSRTAEDDDRVVAAIAEEA